MASLTYDPNLGFLLDGKPVNTHGRVGTNVIDASTASPGALDASAYDPRFYEAYQDNDGDAGQVTRYRLRPEIAERLGNRTQVASHGVGGYGEIIDPSKVTYDEEFGLLTDRQNIKDPATPRDNLIGNLAMAAFALPIGYGVALNSGLLGGAAAGGTNLGTYSGMTTGLDGVTGTLAAEGAGAATGAAGLQVSPEMQALLNEGTAAHGAAADAAANAAVQQGIGGTPWYTQMLERIAANPLSAARAGLGLANIIDGVRNRNSNNGSPGGGPGLLTNGTAPKLDFTGLLSNYKPLQFDPVPFMSGRYGGR